MTFEIKDSTHAPMPHLCDRCYRELLTFPPEQPGRWTVHQHGATLARNWPHG